MVSWKFLSFLFLFLTSNWVNSGDAFLQELNDDFGHLSNVTHRRLVFQMMMHQFYMRIHNSGLLDEIGRRIPSIQSRDAAFLESIMAIGDIDEECRAEVLQIRDQFAMFQNLDIRNCAYYSWESLNGLANERFWPYFEPFTRDAARAASQVLRTLEGRTDLLDAAGLRNELLEELEQYQKVGVEQLTVLEDEVRVLLDASGPIRNDLRQCFDLVERTQTTDHERIMDFLRTNCYDDK